MTRRPHAPAALADGAVHLDRADRIALTDYLATLRDAGPGLESGLLDAFDRLTPHQLDALVVLMAEGAAAPGAGAAAGGPASSSARNADSADARGASPGKRRLSGTAQVVLAGVVACLVCAGGVLVAGLAFGGPASSGPAGTGSTTSSTTSYPDPSSVTDLDWTDDF